jgi:hypothetical protein
MSYENTSLLREDIRELRSRIHELQLENIKLEWRLWDLELKATVLPLACLPLFLILAAIIKHW